MLVVVSRMVMGVDMARVRMAVHMADVGLRRFLYIDMRMIVVSMVVVTVVVAVIVMTVVMVVMVVMVVVIMVMIMPVVMSTAVHRVRRCMLSFARHLHRQLAGDKRTAQVFASGHLPARAKDRRTLLPCIARQLGTYVCRRVRLSEYMESDDQGGRLGALFHGHDPGQTRAAIGAGARFCIRQGR